MHQFFEELIAFLLMARESGLKDKNIDSELIFCYAKCGDKFQGELELFLSNPNQADILSTAEKCFDLFGCQIEWDKQQTVHQQRRQKQKQRMKNKNKRKNVCAFTLAGNKKSIRETQPRLDGLIQVSASACAAKRKNVGSICLTAQPAKSSGTTSNTSSQTAASEGLRN